MVRKSLLTGACLALLAMSSSMASAYDRRVEIVNNCDQTMMEFYASNVDARSWEEDILGRSVLHPGEMVEVNIDDGTGYCRYDLRAVFSSGYAIEREGLNVCEVVRWTTCP